VRLVVNWESAQRVITRLLGNDMRNIKITFFVWFISGCANSGVVQTGPNSFMLAKSEWGFTSGGVHTARLVQEASDYCNSKDKQINVISTKNNDVEFGKTPAAEVHFQCVSK
jgi:hypothetical protein